MTVQHLFPQSPRLCFAPQHGSCTRCHTKLTVRKTRTRTVSTLALGSMQVCETVMECGSCGCIFPSEELQGLVPYRCTFGYDVMVHIGISLFLRCRNEQENRQDLLHRGIKISSSEVSYLAKKFICYLAVSHRESSDAICDYLYQQRGYILHLDATCEGDSPHLMGGLDELSSFVLHTVKISSENQDDIILFLLELRSTYRDPQALVHDMGPAILSAVRQVFPNTPDFICHFHFLRDIGKDLFMREHDTIRNRLKYVGLQTKLRAVLSSCKQVIDRNPSYIMQLTSGFSHRCVPPPCTGSIAVCAHPLGFGWKASRTRIWISL